MTLTISIQDFFRFPDEVASSLGIGEKGQTILSTALGGYLLVFVILALLWGVLELFGAVVRGRQKNRQAIPIPPPQDERPALKPEEPASDPGAGDPELAAVIAAAVSAYTGRPASSFRVVSYRKR